jgi:hypothetical protein
MAALRFRALAEQEVSNNGNFTHMAVLTANDLTETAANTAQTFTVAIPTEALMLKAEVRLKTAFKDASDAALNTTTLSLGDTSTATRYVNAAELNENGTEITAPVFTNTAIGPYAASQNMIATVGSMAAKSLVNVDVGEVHILVQLVQPKIYSDLTPATGMTK